MADQNKIENRQTDKDSVVVENGDTKINQESEGKIVSVIIPEKQATSISKPHQGQKQSCFPHVLTNYGMDSNTQKKKSKPKKERRKKKQQEFLGDDERDKEREKLREEKYLSVVDDLHKLRNFYYREYRDLLTEKIIRQRQEIKDRTDAMLTKARLKEHDEKNKNRKVKQKHKLVHDDEFLRNIPQTETARIVHIEMKLRKLGKLQTQSDIDRFWNATKNPEELIHYENMCRGLGLSPDSTVFSSRPKSEPRPLSQINESAESSRPNTRSDNWAVTQQYKHQHKSSGMIRQKTSSSLGKQPTSSLDKRIPMIEMPPLHCYNLDLSEKPPDPEVVSRRIHLKAIEKQRKKFVGKLLKMHQLAMANQALASRILDQHEDLTMFLDGPQLSDLISDYYCHRPAPYIPSAPTTAPEQDMIQYPVLPEIPSRRNSQESEQLEDDYDVIDEEEKTPSIKALSDTTSEYKVKMLMEKPSVPAPLTMDEIMSQCKIIEAKGLSSNWTNYMKAGKTRDYQTSQPVS